jgi:hypothetical protein
MEGVQLLPRRDSILVVAVAVCGMRPQLEPFRIPDGIGVEGRKRASKVT